MNFLRKKVLGKYKNINNYFVLKKKKKNVDNYVVIRCYCLVEKSEFEKYGKTLYFVEDNKGNRKDITKLSCKYRFGFTSKEVIEQCLNIKFKRLIVYDLSTNEEREITFK